MKIISKVGNYIDGRTKKKYFCINCGKKIKGNKHYNYKNGLSFELYSSDFNNYLKTKIRKRDNHICQLCNKSELKNGRKLDVHHIDYDKKNCDENNLISLCQKCNSKVNANRDYWFAYFTYIIENKYLS